MKKAWLAIVLLLVGCTKHDEFPYTNALIHERSPYLRQHAHNPVNWLPWGPAALERAQREHKPIFLSVGYATCHWCHVMERECFTQPEVAAVLNASFVSIKVDREERPDLDELYMSAVQLVNGSSGWPATLVLMPDGRPFFAGTYMPRAQLMELLQAVALDYQRQPARLERAAVSLSKLVQQSAERSRQSGAAANPEVAIEAALTNLKRSYDPVDGGFGGPLKFPPHSALKLLFTEYHRRGDPSLLKMATHTLDRMAVGAIHDQIGGGFHRYSLKPDWNQPHFEKMLYDNAQLLDAYAEAFQLTANPIYKRVAEDIFSWMERELADPAGGYDAGLDADSDGVEGRYYLWTLGEWQKLLGSGEAEWLSRVYHLSAEGVLSLGPESDLKRRLGLSRKLLQARQARVHPGRDDQVLAGWNGLLLGCLARAGPKLQDSAYLERAHKIGGFLLSKLVSADGRDILHSPGSQDGPRFLEDYAYVIDGLLELGDANSHRAAERLADGMLARFSIPSGALASSRGDSSKAFSIESVNAFDGPLPSPNALAVRALARLQRKEAAVRALSAFQQVLKDSPSAVTGLALAASELNREEVSVRADRRSDGVEIGFSVAPGWHIAAESLKVTGPGLDPLTYPEPKLVKLDSGPDPVRLYDGDFHFMVRLPGPELEVQLQICNGHICKLPEKRRIKIGLSQSWSTQ